MAPARNWLVVFGRVLEVLNSCSHELSQKEIVDASGVSIRSVKYALKKLVSERKAYEIVVSSDLRRKEYVGGKK